MKKQYWFGAIAALGILDLYCAYVKKEGTLSQGSRELFRTDTDAGKAVWFCCWGMLTAWIIPHISNWPEDIKDIADKIS